MRRPRIQPDRKVIAFSRLNVMAFCMVLFIILRWPDKPIHTSFKLNLPTDKHSTKLEKRFNMQELLGQWKTEKSKFVTFNFTGDTAFDGLALCAVEYETRKLRYNEDTTHVIKVHFTADNTFGQFVKLCDIMKFEMMRTYAYSGDDFYAWQINE